LHNLTPVRILLTGSSGLIGRHLKPLLQQQNHQVIRLLRHPPAPNETDALFFDTSLPEPPPLENFDAVIHLAGESIAKRWTKKRKRAILSSRVDYTSKIAQALSRAAKPPAHFLGASGISYYGADRPDELTEQSSPGQGFLTEVAKQWEAASDILLTCNPPTRVVHMRITPVLTPESGMLKKLLPSFKFGFGAVVGSGRQMVSWISLPDMLAAILHILNTSTITGPVNMTAPQAASNREFAKALAKTLHRPLLMRIPATVMKLAFGEMANETILANQNAKPAKLLANNFTFKHPTIEEALADLLIV